MDMASIIGNCFPSFWRQYKQICGQYEKTNCFDEFMIRSFLSNRENIEIVFCFDLQFDQMIKSVIVTKYLEMINDKSQTTNAFPQRRHRPFRIMFVFIQFFNRVFNCREKLLALLLIEDKELAMMSSCSRKRAKETKIVFRYAAIYNLIPRSGHIGRVNNPSHLPDYLYKPLAQIFIKIIIFNFF